MDNSVLTFKEYNIAGNVLRAYYDADGKLVFVLDSTLDDRKPNALLVINPVGDRKWDDILANDYGVDLETVRPKKNNKYQKLDIEYSGLSEYDNLINAYKNGDDLTVALGALSVFREETVRRSATERLAIAEANADKARETILKTKETIDDLQLKLRQLRTKLAQQKKQVGREPTKKSASKILRTDAQIDATNEKLHRARKRLDNAQRRLITADEDAELAREVLSREPVAHEGTGVMAPIPSSVVPVKEPVAAVDAVKDNISDTDDDEDYLDEQASFTVAETEPKVVNVPLRTDDSDAVVKLNAEETDDSETADEDVTEQDDTTDDSLQSTEVKADTMADEDKKEDVQPLFDEDPGILDEDIAFKPIEFGVSSPAESDDEGEVSEDSDVYNKVVEDKPLSFTPPEQPRTVDKVDERHDSADDDFHSAPVLDTLKSVDMPADEYSNEPHKLDSELTGGNQEVQSDKPLNVSPVAPQQVQNAVERPVPPAATISSANNAVRPVSPITGNASPTNPAPRKPTLVYYIMLILLIGLSVFTLWLYQKNTTEKSPDLTATVPATEQIVQESIDETVESPLMPVLETPQETETVQESVNETPAPLPEPEPVKEVLPEPEPVVTPAEPEPEVVEAVSDVVVQPVSQPEPEPVVVTPEPVEVETEEEILASKPSYNVSQNENMFVASPGYDTEVIYDTQQTVDLPMCPDGTAPDVNGCCTGEIYTNMGEMGFNCCPETGGDCFPPLI